MPTASHDPAPWRPLILGHRAVVTSFEAGALEACARQAPGLRRGFISASKPMEALQRAGDLGCVQVALNQRVLDAEVGRAVRAAGLSLVGWQGDTPGQLQRLAAGRVDAFSSHRPDVALAWLREQGHEPALNVTAGARPMPPGRPRGARTPARDGAGLLREETI